jgi:hypothetical protein
LLESHLSFPVLRYYRSQHDNQSWVGALTAILDTSAILVASRDAAHGYQARLTFAMARHAAVDLVLVSQLAPRAPESDRLPPADLARLRESLGEAGDGAALAHALAELRGLYEPFVNALAMHLQFALPPFVPARRPVDNWQTSPGMAPSPGLSGLQAAAARAEPERSTPTEPAARARSAAETAIGLGRILSVPLSRICPICPDDFSRI